MNLIDFPGCCTAEILSGFGQTQLAEYTYRPETFALYASAIAKRVFDRMDYARKTGNATIVVTLNSEQTTALDVLRRMNWHVSDPMSKKAHSEVDLHVCYCDLSVMADEEKREILLTIVKGFT